MDKFRRIYHSAVCPCKANKLKKREREAPLSWYTPRMLDDMFYIWCEATNKFSFDQILSVLFSNLLKNFVIFYRSLHIIESTPITVKTFFHTCI